jgi:DNA-directed RNA polymerase subunit M/transcription elongation factor TFIIS
MDSKKFLITKSDYIAKKLENWKCDKCGNLEEPYIIGKKDDSGEVIEMYIKCRNCDNLITVSKF